MDWKPHFFKQFWTDFSIQHVDFMGFKLGEYIRFIYGQHKGYLAGYNGIQWDTICVLTYGKMGMNPMIRIY